MDVNKNALRFIGQTTVEINKQMQLTIVIIKEDIQMLTSSSTASRLVRQLAQPRSETLSLSLSHPTLPSSLSIPFTSGFESASLISEDPASITDSSTNFSQVYSPSLILSETSI